jgi:type IV pilus assembly protein PilF
MKTSMLGIRFALACISSVALYGCASTGGTTPTTATERTAAAETQVDLGVGYLQQGRTELALERFQKALAFNPKSANAHTSLGVLYERIKQPDLAEKSYRRAAALEPKKGGVHNNLGQFLCRTGGFDEADKEFKLALTDPFYTTPAVAAANAGKCARAAGNMDAAEQYLRKALELKPDFTEAFLPLADMLYTRGQAMNARAFLQRYESSGLPQNAEFLKLAGNVEAKLGDSASAAGYRERLESQFPDEVRGTEKSGSESDLSRPAQESSVPAPPQGNNTAPPNTIQTTERAQ